MSDNNDKPAISRPGVEFTPTQKALIELMSEAIRSAARYRQLVERLLPNFTPEEDRQIRDLFVSGDTLGAQKLILSILSKRSNSQEQPE